MCSASSGPQDTDRLSRDAGHKPGVPQTHVYIDVNTKAPPPWASCTPMSLLGLLWPSDPIPSWTYMSQKPSFKSAPSSCYYMAWTPVSQRRCQCRIWALPSRWTEASRTMPEPLGPGWADLCPGSGDASEGGNGPYVPAIPMNPCILPCSPASSAGLESLFNA